MSTEYRKPPRKGRGERARSVVLHRISRGWVVGTRDGTGSHYSEAFASETEARAYAAARAVRVFGAG